MTTDMLASGSLDAEFVLVGEAPGATEVITGKPFSNAANNLLGRLLESAGISHSSCYVTNVVKEQPSTVGGKTNCIDSFLNLKKKPIFESVAYKQYVAQLRKELSKTSANIIIALGNVPLYALTGHQNILKRRGSLYESTLLPGRKVMGTIHPRECLHGNHEYQYFILFDLLRAKENSTFSELRIPRRNLVIEPSFDYAMQRLREYKQSKMVGFDIEVVNLELSCFALGDRADESICIPLIEGGRDYFSPEQELAIMKELEELLLNDKQQHLGQNIGFDATFMLHKYGIKIRNLQDTMVAQAILYPDFPRGLDFIVSIFSNGTPYYKDDGKTYFKFGGSQHEFWKYNCMDCCVLFDAFKEQEKQLKQLGNWETYLDVAKLIEPLVFMSANGMKVDVEAKHAASTLVEKRVLALTAQFQQLCGSAVNPNSPQQLMKYFYETKQEKPYKNRKTGNDTTDEDALKRLSRKGYEEAKLLLEIRSLEKLNGTYLKMRLDSDERIRCSYNPVGTVSGRLSSSKNIFGVGGNMQNLPRDNYEFEDNNEA